MRRALFLSSLAVAAILASPAAAPPIRWELPPGFRIETYASGLDAPTAMAWGPDGRLYVTQTEGSLVVVRRGSRRPVVVARSLRTPLGLAWHGRLLFVSQQGRLERFVLRGTRLGSRRTLARGLPFGRHQQDNVVVGVDGRLYLGSGSTCDACRERDRRSAAILSMRRDGSDLRIVARGLRNPFGLAVQPGTGRLYASVNEQDELGSAARPEPAETVVIVRRGAHYGWPRCWPSYRRKRMVGRCRGVTRPIAYLEPHSSADGIAFYTGDTYPGQYRGDLFVALWGQYDSERHGRRVVRLDLLPDGRSRRVTEFADGFDHPLALVVDPQGALLVADWGRGVIYRIQARGGP
jgi:glucose/arabinose dehydrogenase